ncbi:MAG TPA: alpha/beta hydrolase [Thermoanaerobaculia bacterium]|jgi:acetyl esterase/lipase
MLRVLALLALFAQPAPAVQRDIPYVPGGDHQQQLDIYVPAVKGFPTLILVHGGSLTSEDKNDPPYERLCPAFQAAGVGCANVNYRLARHAKWPAMPKDVAAAFAWVKRNVPGRGGDPKRIFLLGHSSGCHLVSLISADPRYLKEHGFATSEIAGVVAMGCRLNDWNLKDRCMTIEQARPYFERDRDEKVVFDTIEDRVAANPTLYIGSHVPPFLALVAETERFQPPILEEAAAFARKLQEAGVEADVRVLEDRKHMSAVEKMPEPDDPTFRIVLDFIRRH